MMRRVRSTLSDSDNKAISVQVQLDLDLPTGTELGNNSCHKWYSHTCPCTLTLIEAINDHFHNNFILVQNELGKVSNV